jgi:hypothetical protein
MGFGGVFKKALKVVVPAAIGGLTGGPAGAAVGVGVGVSSLVGRGAGVPVQSYGAPRQFTPVLGQPAGGASAGLVSPAASARPVYRTFRARVWNGKRYVTKTYRMRVR